jgi:hypothetical protein
MGLQHLAPDVKGHVPTPPGLVDLMVAKLFNRRAPKPSDLVLDPGCGEGAFIEGVVRYCRDKRLRLPRIVGVESDGRRVALAARRFADEPQIALVHADYLGSGFGPARFIIGNPPYVPITKLDDEERQRFRSAFASARGRFDLYLLFFEQSLRNLAAGGRLVFVTPEKFEYVASAAALREALARFRITELHHLPEDAFPGFVTYPTITTLEADNVTAQTRTRIIERNGGARVVSLPRDGASWTGSVRGATVDPCQPTLEDACIRISAGIATGADQVFVRPERSLRGALARFAFPTISGRQLTRQNGFIEPTEAMLVPYTRSGSLRPLEDLGELGDFLASDENRSRLVARTCVTKGGKPWYAFHDSAPLLDILVPKILCKDIARTPRFWADLRGNIVPRHSVYYVVPKPGLSIGSLLEYLNSTRVQHWLESHCQHAANGFLRLQSSVLKRLPVPETLLPRAVQSQPCPE